MFLSCLFFNFRIDKYGLRLTMVLECVNNQIFKMNFQNNVKLKLLVLKCVKVGEKCFISEGLTPTTSEVENVIQSGSNPKCMCKYGVYKSC